MEIVRISPAKRAWLERESGRWREAGAIDDEARTRILGGYESEPFVKGPLLLIVLAILMFGIGVLLLIGYNWHRIPDAGKVAMILAAIAAAFAGSAVAYRRQRETVGESLALLGTLLYGNGIWLIAQVLHIQGHFPDAFLWFGIGACVSAFLLRSTWIGVETAALLVAWVFAASSASRRPEFLFLAGWPIVVALAYRLRSPITLAIAAFGMPVWAFFSTVATAREPMFVGVTAATGCALYAIARWHRESNPMRPAWEIAGLLPLLIMFIPLLVSEMHREAARLDGGAASLPIMIVAASAACVVTLVRQRAHDAAATAVLIVSAVLFAWTVALAFGVGSQPWFALASTIVFSVLALLLAVSFIRTALRTNGSRDLGFGALFAAVFLVVRWTSVIHNMFLSGMIMLAAGAALLFVVRLWRQRDRALVLHGRLS